MERPRDTSPEAQERLHAAYRSITSADRLRLADSMSCEVRALTAAGIKRRHPLASDEQRADTLAEILLREPSLTPPAV